MASENVAIMSKESICHQFPFQIRFGILLKTEIECIATKKKCPVQCWSWYKNNSANKTIKQNKHLFTSN